VDPGKKIRFFQSNFRQMWIIFRQFYKKLDFPGMAQIFEWPFSRLSR